MISRAKKYVAVLLVFVCVCMIFSPLTAYAAEDSSQHETVKVGFFAMDGYHMMDEDELNREITTALLEEIGIIVDFVEDGTDAVERMNEVEDDRYDLIFMDIQMSKMDGYMTTREIRTLRNNRKANIPIVAMTANAQEPVKENHQERIEHYQKILLQKKNARTSGGMSVPDNDQEASEPKKEILGKKKSIVGRLRRHQAEIAAKEGKPVSKYLEMQLEREKKK